MTDLDLRLARMARLLEISRELASTTSLERLLHKIVEAAVELTGSETAGILLEKGGELRFVAVHAYAEQVFDIPVPIDASIAGACFASGEVVIVPNVRQDPRYYPDVEQALGYEARSLLAVPLESGTQRIGVLEVENERQPADEAARHPFRPEDVETLRVLAAQATVAIENARLVEALQAARDEARQALAENRELDAFARTVAHDLKSPLALLASWGELTTMCLDEQDRCGVRQGVQKMVGMGHKMAAIVDDLLLLSTVERQDEVSIEPLDMTTIVRAARGRLDAIIERHHAQVVWPQEWPSAMGHGPWVEAVWANYMSNAIRYGGSRRNGATPRVTLGADEKVPHKNGSPMVRLWVRDNGPGLTPEEQAELFAEFRQLGNGDGAGHGLGLSIVRRIVEKLGGKVGVESAPGQGSLFYFTLPAENGHSRAKDDYARPDSPPCIPGPLLS
jgi:signal transduction histidine kinase